MKDKIIQEVWQAKDAVATRHNHDVYALARHLRQQDKETPELTIDLHVLRKAAGQNVAVRVAESPVPYAAMKH